MNAPTPVEIEIDAAFREDFALAAAYWRREGVSADSIKEIREGIWVDLKAGMDMEAWSLWLHDVATFQKSLTDMAVGINERIRKAIVTEKKRKPKKLNNLEVTS
jgi:hypothetical protein